MSDDKGTSEDNCPSDSPDDRTDGSYASIDPIRDPDDLLGDALRRMNERQRDSIVTKAADEALRLDVKEAEGAVDRDMGESKVCAAAEAARRLEGTGAEFEVRTEHRSQHGSIYVNVRSKRPPLAARIAPALSANPRGAIRATLVIVALLGLIALGVRVISGNAVAPDPSAKTTAPTSLSGATRAAKLVDGDTLAVSSLNGVGTKEKIRLLAIDTPERGQPWYTEASAALAELVGDRPITLEYERPDRIERDKYGRVLAYLMVDGQNVNVEMVRRGWSAYVTKYGGSRFARDFTAAEEEAHAAHRGIWSSR
jgi:micrococcal nuclease